MMKDFYTFKKLQAEIQDFQPIKGLEYRMDGEYFVATLHGTDIVRVSPGNSVILRTGSAENGFWRTGATQKCINQVLYGWGQVHFSKVTGDILALPGQPSLEYPFMEGVVFNAEEQVVVDHGNDSEYKISKRKRR
jgi:hypothetical protein